MLDVFSFPDDDDSKSQDRIDEGAVGVQQQTTMVEVAAASGGSASSSQSAGRGGTNDGAAGSPAGQGADSSSVASSGNFHRPSGHMTAASQPAGSSGSSSFFSAAQAQLEASNGVDSESTGNGQKLLNGGIVGGGGDSQTGVLGSFGGGVSHPDYTGTIRPPGHDFLLGLMGGGDPWGPGAHMQIPGHMTPPTQLDSAVSVMSSGVTAAPSADQNRGSSLDSPADPAQHSDISISQSGPDHTSLSSVSDSSHSTAQGDEADTPDANGNSRQTLLTHTNSVTDRLVPLSELQTHLQTEPTGGAEEVTGLHIGLTVSGLGLGHDVTESSPIALHTESGDSFSHTLHPASGGYSHTDVVTMAADSTGTDTGRPAVTDHTQMAGSACSLQVQSLNSTTHLVRVLKVQKMWNWRIPADFHIKPRVRFLRYRFQCTNQSARPRKSDPSH
uniref:PE-PGRS family protein PE_PGRS5 isoform X5 n=1 Tax=Scatophagus argus TaxID=75038 RepID=UPI001ED865BA|nr:PE-PGRS family protein PE_PGRS5 isoform X5 [Scatophagus argus]